MSKEMFFGSLTKFSKLTVDRSVHMWALPSVNICWHTAFVLLVSRVYSCLPLCLQAWWITNTVSTDLWGRWELTSSVWHYTNLKNYPEGKTPQIFQ